MDFQKIISSAPQTPGIYLFKNRRGKVIYIGKAANLRSRLRSYLRAGWKDEMMKEASSVVWEELSSDIEALIREATVIKEYRPHYNILLRDDKNYFYVVITKEKFPRIYLSHQPFIESARYIGPFTDGGSIKRVLRLLRKTFPYCTCPSPARHVRPCVNAEIGKCHGFCCTRGAPTPDDYKTYRANIRAITKVLTGKVAALKKDLVIKMERAAADRRYEDARLCRDQVASLERIFAHSPYLKRELPEERRKALFLLRDLLGMREAPQRIEGYDISHYHGASSVASMVVFLDGVPARHEYRKFIMRSTEGINDFAMMQEVLSRRLRHPEWPMPDVFLIDGGKGQLSSAIRTLKGVGLKTHTVALAKREEELYLPNTKTPIRLKTMPPSLLHLLTSIRDEAHRCAVSFHRKRRSRLAKPA